MKCNVSREAARPCISSHRMKIGQIGKVMDNPLYEGEVVLCTFAGLVSLTSPTNTWTGNNCLLNVELLPVGTVVELTAE